MKTWKRPTISILSTNNINSGTAPYGAEFLLTCGGEILLATIPYNYRTSNCVSQNPAGTIYCTGINLVVGSSSGFSWASTGSPITFSFVCS